MKKLQSLQRRNAVFAAAAVVLLAIVILRPTETSIVRATDLPLLFPKFEGQIASARSIVLERVPPAKKPEAKEGAAGTSTPEPQRLEFARRDEAWVLASSFDHPTREGNVQRLLDAIGRARQKEPVTNRADTFPSYADDEGWTRVEVKDGTGQALASFSVGKSANWPEVYLLVDQQPPSTGRVVRATGFERDVASLSTNDWIEALLWPGLRSHDVSRIDVEQRKDQRTISFERTAPEAAAEPGKEPGADGAEPKAKPPTWRMRSPKEGEAIRNDVDGLVSSFAGLRAKDVVAGSTNAETEAKYGMNDLELVITATRKPEDPAEKPTTPTTYLLEVGKKSEDGKDWYVRRKGQSWIYVVAGDDLDPFRKDPDSFLVKKDEPKKDEAKPDEAKPDDAKPEEPKPGEPKKEEPGPDGPKAEEPKKEEPGKDAPKDAEPPKDDGETAEGSPDGK